MCSHYLRQCHAQSPTPSTLEIYLKYCFSTAYGVIPRLQLDIIVHQPNLFARLECRQSNVRAPVAPEGVPKRTVTAASNLALNSEIHLCQIIGTELHGIEGFVGRFALCGILGFDLLLHTAGAVFAGAASLSGFGATLRCCDC